MVRVDKIYVRTYGGALLEVFDDSVYTHIVLTVITQSNNGYLWSVGDRASKYSSRVLSQVEVLVLMDEQNEV